MAKPAQKRFVYCIVVLMALVFSRSQGQEYSFRHLTTENGLPTNYTISVLKDSRGFIWIATRAGICRYDGYNMKVFQYDPGDSASISDNQVTRKYCMTEDSAGNLWIATKRGLNKYNYITESFKRYQHDPDDPASISRDRIFCLYTDRSGTLWIGTGDGGGLNRYNPETDDFTIFQDVNDSSKSKLNIIMAMCEDRKGNFWVASSNNLFLFERENGSFTRVDISHLFNNLSGQIYFKTIYEHPSGSLFFGTSKGLLVYDIVFDKIGAFEPFFDNGAFFTDLDVIADPVLPDRQLWIAGWNLHHCDLLTGDVTPILPEQANPASIKGNMIFSLYSDPDGLLWMTSEFGVNILGPLLNQIHQHRDFAGKYRDAMSFLEDSQGHTWIGSVSSLVHFDGEMKVLEEFQTLPVRGKEVFNGNIWSIYEDSEKNLWVGTEENGLFVREYGMGEFEQCIFEGTDPGSIPVFIWKITEDSDGYLWFCTLTYGLFKKKTMDKPLTFIKRDDKLQISIGNAQSPFVFEDHSGHLWIATQDKGLFMQSPEMKGTYDFIHY